VGIGSIELTSQEGRKHRLNSVYYAPKASKQLLSEGKLLTNDGLIRSYCENTRQTGKFILQADSGDFSINGQIVNDLYFVFEARTSHQAYAITRSKTASQRDDEQHDEQDDKENWEKEHFPVGSANGPIRSHDFGDLTLKSPAPSPTLPPATSPSSPTPNGVQIGETVDEAILWHNRLVHRAISTLQKAGIISKVIEIDPHHFGKAYVEGKQTKLPYHPYTHTAKRILWRVHSDMSGMSIPGAKKGYLYFITFVDDLSCYAWVYFTVRKDAKSIEEVYKECRADAENKSGHVVSYLQTDEGGEYEKEMGVLLKDSGTTHLTSPPHSQQSNGLAENYNRKLKDAARTIMIHANLPQAFWAKAVKFANQVNNMLPHKATGRIPYEIFFDQLTPSLDRFRVFGCIIEPLVEKETRPALSMWDKRANRNVYDGTDSRSRYEYWDITNRRFNHTYNCTFFEKEFPTPDEFPTFQTEPRTRKRGIPAVPISQQPEAQPQIPSESEGEATPQPMQDMIVVQNGPPPDEQRPPHESNVAQYPVNDNPTFEQALAGSDAGAWKQAMLEELHAIDKNEVWQMEPPPLDRKALGSRWVLTVKRDAQGNVERFKARLVVQEFGQEFGFDCDETYAAVIRIDNVRLLFAIGAYHRDRNVDMWHVDFNNAFQNGGADYGIYIQQPPGFKNPQFPQYVLLLLKSLYGLKQASRIWFIVLCELIQELGFTACQTDQCTFYSNDKRILIAVYVDDLLMLGKPKDNGRCVNELSHRFKLRNHGPVKSFLGLNIEYASDGIHLNQIGYIHRKAEEFHLMNSKPVDTPLDYSLPLVKATPDDKLCDQTTYQELTGSLNHLAITSRPDITFAVSRLCQFNSNPTVTHFKAGKRVLRYVIHMRHYSLKYGVGSSKDHELKLIGYADADYGSNLIDRKSTTGYIFVFNGGPISWSSRKQPTVAMSTMEAEYMALSDAIRKLLS
jgi:Reverse transcriptase (RNA-dependent DNA polymerase)